MGDRCYAWRDGRHYCWRPAVQNGLCLAHCGAPWAAAAAEHFAPRSNAEAVRRAAVAWEQAELMSSTMREVVEDITRASRRATLPSWRRWLIRLLAR